MPEYWTHGFGVSSEWELPRGTPLAAVGAKLSLRIEAREFDWCPDPDGAGEQFDCEGADHYFYWRILGKVRVGEHGNVEVQPRQGAPEGIVPHAIAGPVLAHWILRQGGIALHSNCVRVDGRLLALVGASGAGKSSLTAALIRQGAEPHTDDVSAVALGTALVPFGASRVKLNPDVIDAIGLNGISAQPVYGGAKKQSVELCPPTDQGALALEAIYRLVDGPAAPRFDELKGFPMIAAILSEVYRPHVAAQSPGLQAMVDRIVTLMGRVRFFDLCRERELAHIDDLAAQLIRHFKALRE